MVDGPSSAGSGGALRRALVAGLVLFVLVLGVVALVAWLAEGPEHLPFEYGGFG